MAVSLVRYGLRTLVNLEKNAAVLSVPSVRNQYKAIKEKVFLKPKRTPLRPATQALLRPNAGTRANFGRSYRIVMLIHTKPTCNGNVCYLKEKPRHVSRESRDVAERPNSSLRRSYSKQHGRPEENRRKQQSDSDSDSDSDTECKGYDRSEFWRRKMRTVHNILDVDKDGLISFNDFLLFAERFKSLGHLDEQQSKEFTDIIKLTWEEQWGAIDPYNFVTVEQYLEDMHHVLNDKTLKARAHRWLPYLFKAVDKDKSGFISVKEFKLFFQCLGLDNEHAAVAFAVIDTNGDGKLSLKEFVKLGKEFFFTEDEKRVSKMFWGPLIDV